MFRMILAALGLSLVVACSTSFEEKAYTLGKSYDFAQKTAITYIEVAKPSSEFTGKIVAADAKAAPMVKQVLECAKELISPSPEPEATVLGLNPNEQAAATEEVCEDLLSQALLAVEAVNKAVKEN